MVCFRHIIVNTVHKGDNRDDDDDDDDDDDNNNNNNNNNNNHATFPFNGKQCSPSIPGLLFPQHQRYALNTNRRTKEESEVLLLSFT